MYSLKRFLASLFLCGLLVPNVCTYEKGSSNCFADESAPPAPNTPSPSEPAPAPGGGSDSSGDSGGGYTPGEAAN